MRVLCLDCVCALHAPGHQPDHQNCGPKKDVKQDNTCWHKGSGGVGNRSGDIMVGVIHWAAVQQTQGIIGPLGGTLMSIIVLCVMLHVRCIRPHNALASILSPRNCQN